MGLRAVWAAPTRSISRPILRRIQKPFGHLFRDTPGINAPRCDKEGHGTRGDSEKSMQGCMIISETPKRLCKGCMIVSHTVKRPRRCCMVVSHTVKGLCRCCIVPPHTVKGLRRCCIVILHTVKGPRRCCIVISHTVKGPCRCCIVILHTVPAPRTCCTLISHTATACAKGGGGSLRACADSHRSRCLLDTIGIPPPGAEARIHYTARESPQGTVRI